MENQPEVAARSLLELFRTADEVPSAEWIFIDDGSADKAALPMKVPVGGTGMGRLLCCNDTIPLQQPSILYLVGCGVVLSPPSDWLPTAHPPPASIKYVECPRGVQVERVSTRVQFGIQARI